ncbi:glutamate-5-semialdehyde dehydrogenase [Paraliomyxa miuraensis]|uniref:glutamate-5-semialdehyde dehydrogenase n=1 Tax=Paraliomyxa miuraensis TaxID=376150 RepID=UPI00224EA4FF|nr:glutamate-5-semialdehyde dehydrogenase [Paraliomyxa miuraensis]MCX4242111.1 glutamate-5-semialdehyde dehydrogenase [Paraliomyxa miuraensis]
MADPSEHVRQLARLARAAGAQLARATGPDRRSVLLALADELARPDARGQILAANAEDLREAEALRDRGELAPALVDRLALSDKKLDGLCDGLGQLADQVDLIGRIELERELDDGLVLRRVSCPLGVLGVVFEARPDAVPQIAGLALRTGNAVLLKGGREARRSNAALVRRLRDALHAQGLHPAAVTLLEDRAEVDALLKLERGIDLVIARGSSAFVRHVQSRTSIPVLGHAEGLCHLYLHHTASPPMAARIAVDAKCSYPAACNSIETLLWEPGAEPALLAALEALRRHGVELRGCEATRAKHPDLLPATDEDWSTEYGELVLSIKRVEHLDDALAHIERYGSRHTEAIVASDPLAASTFLAAVDAAGVFHNASTRFADGYRYGLGAEVGISTGKLHARGPVGVEGLVTYRWLLRGEGQVASDYGPGKRAFVHRTRTPPD